jgi:hypothetical protein
VEEAGARVIVDAVGRDGEVGRGLIVVGICLDQVLLCDLLVLFGCVWGGTVAGVGGGASWLRGHCRGWGGHLLGQVGISTCLSTRKAASWSQYCSCDASQIQFLREP